MDVAYTMDPTANCLWKLNQCVRHYAEGVKLPWQIHLWPGIFILHMHSTDRYIIVVITSMQYSRQWYFSEVQIWWLPLLPLPWGIRGDLASFFVGRFVGSLDRSFVTSSWLIEKSSPIFVKWSADIQHLCQTPLLNFERFWVKVQGRSGCTDGWYTTRCFKITSLNFVIGGHRAAMAWYNDFRWNSRWGLAEVCAVWVLSIDKLVISL